MISPFCHISLHYWRYSREKHKVEGHPNDREFIRVVVRECKWCGHREHHRLPRVGRKLTTWKSFDDIFTTWKSFDDIKKDETIKFERL